MEKILVIIIAIIAIILVLIFIYKSHSNTPYISASNISSLIGTWIAPSGGSGTIILSGSHLQWQTYNSIIGTSQTELQAGALYITLLKQSPQNYVYQNLAGQSITFIVNGNNLLIGDINFVRS